MPQPEVTVFTCSWESFVQAFIAIPPGQNAPLFTATTVVLSHKATYDLEIKINLLIFMLEHYCYLIPPDVFLQYCSIQTKAAGSTSRKLSMICTGPNDKKTETLYHTAVRNCSSMPLSSCTIRIIIIILEQDHFGRFAVETTMTSDQ